MPTDRGVRTGEFRARESAYPRHLLELCLRAHYRESAMDILDYHIDRKRKFHARAAEISPAACSGFDQRDTELTAVVADLVQVCVTEIDGRLDAEGPSMFFKNFPKLGNDPLEIAGDLIAADKDGRHRLMYVLTASAAEEMW